MPPFKVPSIVEFSSYKPIQFLQDILPYRTSISIPDVIRHIQFQFDLYAADKSQAWLAPVWLSWKMM